MTHPAISTEDIRAWFRGVREGLITEENFHAGGRKRPSAITAGSLAQQ